jgi:RNA polymerase sigma factor (sigma-70 family)
VARGVGVLVHVARTHARQFGRTKPVSAEGQHREDRERKDPLHERGIGTRRRSVYQNVATVSEKKYGYWNRFGSERLLGVGPTSLVEQDADFEEFYATQWSRLVAALAHAVPDGDDPRDAAQEAFARAYARWSSVSRHERPDAWLFLTGFRIATRIRRRAARRPEAGPADAPELFGNVDVMLALAQLSQRQRAALLLREIYGLSTKETARALRCREGTVKSLLARGRAALAMSLSEEGSTHD